MISVAPFGNATKSVLDGVSWTVRDVETGMVLKARELGDAVPFFGWFCTLDER